MRSDSATTVGGIRTGETAFLFLQHFIRLFKAGGRGGIVIKNTFLSNTDNASVSLRKLLLQNCNLHTVLDCPGSTFQGAGVKTVVLFFEKGAPTRKGWFYQLDPGRNMGKTNTLTPDFVDQAGLNTRTAAQPKLALSRLSTIKLGIPPFAEQKQLAAEFDALREEAQRLVSLYTRKLAALEALKKSLLRQAFSGEL